MATGLIAKLAEGFDAPDPSQQRPIDVQYGKLIDWMIERMLIPRDWQRKVVAIRSRITAALEDMPSDPTAVALLTGQYIDYYVCQELIDVLKNTSEDGARSFFGRYSSQRMKDWLDVVAAYQNEHLFLAECGHMLVQMVRFDLPDLKRDEKRLRQQLSDLDRREKTNLRSSESYAKRYSEACAKLGIKGDDLIGELSALPDQLPAIYRQVTALLQGDTMREAVRMYRDFAKHILVDRSSLIAALDYLQEHGDVPSNDFLQKVMDDDAEPTTPSAAHSSTSPTPPDDEASALGGAAVTIDWGDLDDAATAAAATNTASGDASAPAIDWGDDDFAIVSSSAGNAGAPPTIDWGDDGDTAPLATKASTAGFEIKVVSAGEAASESMLDNGDSRSRVLDDLMELQSFLQQRLSEMRSDSQSADRGLDLMRGASVFLQTVSVARVEAYYAAVMEAMALLDGAYARQLMQLRTSKPYVKRVAAGLQQKLDLSHKMAASIDAIASKRADLQARYAEVQPAIDKLKASAQRLRVKLEQDLTKALKGRRVNVMVQYS